MSLRNNQLRRKLISLGRTSFFRKNIHSCFKYKHFTFGHSHFLDFLSWTFSSSTLCSNFVKLIIKLSRCAPSCVQLWHILLLLLGIRFFSLPDKTLLSFKNPFKYHLRMKPAATSTDNGSHILLQFLRTPGSSLAHALNCEHVHPKG